MGSTVESGTNSAMSITLEASPSSDLVSSSVKRTYWSFWNQWPLTMAPRSTCSLSTGKIICWRRRLPHLAWSWLKLTPPAEAAVYILTGMETSPKEIVPDPSECGDMIDVLPTGEDP